MKVFIVMAEIHDYSDSVHWIVSAHKTEAGAKARSEAALARSKEIEAWRCAECERGTSWHGAHRECQLPVPVNEFDPNMSDRMYGEFPDSYDVIPVEVVA